MLKQNKSMLQLQIQKCILLLLIKNDKVQILLKAL